MTPSSCSHCEALLATAGHIVIRSLFVTHKSTSFLTAPIFSSRSVDLEAVEQAFGHYCPCQVALLDFCKSSTAVAKFLWCPLASLSAP